ncbi:polyphosphate kinase 2 [bacterium]|nr:polyphosphate kinase 2 [bacterium]MBU1958101.1 polyphosphate kinase 2 [bacterium]
MDQFFMKTYETIEEEFTAFKEIYKEAIVKENAKKILKPYQEELLKLQRHLEKHNKKMIILFEGRDASGKGGTIRRMTRFMNEKHYRVIALGKPSDVQKTQWFFQRYTEKFPRAGEIVLFDRSWYNRAMVEPIFGFCTKKEHKIFMQEVIKFEETLVNEGIILIKLYFSVSKEEQARRFEERQKNPLKKWKFSEVDMQAQELWGEFTEKKFQMLKKTDTESTPWFIIRSDDKYTARLEAMKVILNVAKYRGRKRDLDFTLNPDIVIRGRDEYTLMKKELQVFRH